MIETIEQFDAAMQEAKNKIEAGPRPEILIDCGRLGKKRVVKGIYVRGGAIIITEGAVYD